MSGQNEASGMERRKSPRIMLDDSHGLVDGELYSLSNWSREGAMISGYDGDLQVGDDLPIRLEINLPQGYLRIEGTARVARRQGSEMGLQWALKPCESEGDRTALVDFFLATNHGAEAANSR